MAPSKHYLYALTTAGLEAWTLPTSFPPPLTRAMDIATEQDLAAGVSPTDADGGMGTASSGAVCWPCLISIKVAEAHVLCVPHIIIAMLVFILRFYCSSYCSDA